MPNKLTAYLDLTLLQGALRASLKGEDCIIIRLSQARAKPSARNPAKVFLNLDLVPNRDGKDDFGNTHWIAEPLTKEEREATDRPKTKILGNAREYVPEGTPPARASSSSAPAADGAAAGFGDGLEDDEIPF
jgi:hypothetical protein